MGLLAGAHTSTWGMDKDSPHEGFTWRKCLRSTLLSALIALAWPAAVGLDLESAGARVVLFGLTYVPERGLVELNKTYLMGRSPLSAGTEPALPGTPPVGASATTER